MSLRDCILVGVITYLQTAKQMLCIFCEPDMCPANAFPKLSIMQNSYTNIVGQCLAVALRFQAR